MKIETKPVCPECKGTKREPLKRTIVAVGPTVRYSKGLPCSRCNGIGTVST
jgi:hypothetical protein